MAVRTDTTMTIRMNKNVKQEAQKLFSALGMDMTTAINVFLRQAIRAQGLPFAVRLELPNEETLAAFEEGERMLCDPAAPRFNSVDALFDDLEAQ